MMQPFPEIFGLPVFAGAVNWEVLLLMAVYGGSFFIKGAIGIGSISLMVILGAMIVEPHHAVVLAAVSNTVVQLQFIPQAHRDGDYGVIKTAILPYFVGIAAGVSLFGFLSGTWLTVVLGVFVGGLIGLELTGVLGRWFARVDLKSKKFLFPFTSGSGFIVGVSGAGGLMALAFYVKQILTSVRSIRGTLLLIGIIFSVLRVGSLAVAGFVDLTIIVEVLITLPFGLLGGWLGSKFFGKLSEKNYRIILNSVILFAAAILIVKGLLQLV